MANYIISLDSIIKTFSVVGTGVEFDYTQESEKDTNINLQLGDTVLGYVGDPIREIRYGFKLKAKRGEKELKLVKEFEFAEGLDRDYMPETVNRLLKGLLNGQMALIDDADHSAIISALLIRKVKKRRKSPRRVHYRQSWRLSSTGLFSAHLALARARCLMIIFTSLGQTMNV